MEERIKKLENEVRHLREVVRKFSLIIDKIERGSRTNSRNLNAIENKLLRISRTRDDE